MSYRIFMIFYDSWRIFLLSYNLNLFLELSVASPSYVFNSGIPDNSPRLSGPNIGVTWIGFETRDFQTIFSRLLKKIVELYQILFCCQSCKILFFCSKIFSGGPRFLFLYKKMVHITYTGADFWISTKFLWELTFSRQSAKHVNSHRKLFEIPKSAPV